MVAQDPQDIPMDGLLPSNNATPPVSTAADSSSAEHGNISMTAASGDHDVAMAMDIPPTTPLSSTEVPTGQPLKTVITEYTDTENGDNATPTPRDDIPPVDSSEMHVDGPSTTSKATLDSYIQGNGRRSRISIFEEASSFSPDDFHDAMESVTVSDHQSHIEDPMQGISTEEVVPFEEPKRDDTTLDLVHRVVGMYRLLDLVSEEGSTGLVEKVIMDADGMRLFMEAICPGAYTSMTQVDFRALDTVVVNPIGVYGSKETIVQFLKSGNKIDDETVELLLKDQTMRSVDQPALRSGLYIVHSDSNGPDGQVVYVVYWPEETTWDDNASSTVKRNRVTFMRYLTKLCDQLLAFISSAHASTLVWGDDSDADDDEEGEHQDDSRVFSFQVKKTTGQEDNVEILPGFQLRDFALKEPKFLVNVPGDFMPRLVPGETQQGFMTAAFVPGRVNRHQLRNTSNNVHLASLIKDADGIRLGPDISNAGIVILFENGLERFARDIYAEYRENIEEIERVEQARRSNVSKGENARLEEDRLCVVQAMRLHVMGVVQQRYKDGPVTAMIEESLFREPATNVPPKHSQHAETTHDGAPGTAVEENGHSSPDFDQMHIQATAEWTKLVAAFPGIERPMQALHKTHWENVVKDSAYSNLKARIVAGINYVTETDTLNPEDATTLTHDILTGKHNKISDKFTLPSSSRPTGVLGKALATGKAFLGLGSEVVVNVKDMSDPEFIAWVMKKAEGREYFEPVVSRLVEKCAEVWTRVAKQHIQPLSHEAAFHIQNKRKEQVKQDTDRLTIQKTETARVNFLTKIASRLPNKPGRLLILNQIDPSSRWSSSGQLTLSGQIESPQESKIEYTIRSLSISNANQAAIRSDPSCLPEPRVPPGNNLVFDLPVQTTIRHVQLIDTDKVLLITEDSTGMFIFVDKRTSLPGALKNNVSKRTLKREKYGSVLIAYDEGSHLLAILSTDETRCVIHVFAIDDKDCSVRPRGSPVDISRWLEGSSGIAHICFVTGSGQEELCIVEQSGRSRIFSLVTETCRPASLQMPTVPSRIFSAPDGSCLIGIYPDNKVTAYHWDSFGSSEGFPLAISGKSLEQASLTSFVTRSCIHLLTTNIADKAINSFRLRIQKRSSEFHLRQDRQTNTTREIQITAHNCILDCLSDVWTRFPVVPAIGNDTVTIGHAQARLTYICDKDHDRFSSHFGAMIRRFERTTRKPTQHILDKIIVHAMAFNTFSTTGITWSMSSVRAGDWVIKSISLLPIQIAVARDNRFLPLKDGVWSGALEQHMLGLSVNQVAGHITFGWYESIFTHYDKPVKVVSSMGEQSTGKSYMLSHLVDTSFAGSAMRCTEGVWMCVTPTASALFVALDFEGVHSLERSVQEDALLVLFNAAISNLILFRNNFAMSRNIAGMFTSFQSSSSLFDPKANPTLFQSCLAIIIKDVVDADTQGIVQEFEDKFQRIVSDEQDANFITRLHRGQLRIIPWPVIESRKYYTAYNRLKQELTSQAASHPRAGVFLHTMKTLMAKIKACDWGALDQNLAAHRAEQLRHSLHNALMLGLDHDRDPLKDLDTNNEIPHSDTDASFYAAGPVFEAPDDPTQREAALATLCTMTGWHLARQDIPDEEWMTELIRRLETLVDARVSHVQNWFSINTSRFEGHADIQQTLRILDAGVLEVRDSVVICRSRCVHCQLFCTLSKRHQGQHDCQAGHVCKHVCSFDEHNDDHVGCGLTAGHAGKHMCEVGLHLCGRPCAHSSKPGCLGKCMKDAEHLDSGHICSARTHGCGELCAMYSTGMCAEHCVTSFDEPHEIHDCKARGCPFTCGLCKRLCASPDHFHGLRENVVHLCGQDHPCTHNCESDGICEVSTDPIAVETTFTGKHDTFQFTKFTQNVKRLVCAVPIPAGELAHRGHHVHDQSPKPFHYCTSRCTYCGYVCTLPYGHTQREHETSHGSMSNTEWTVEGDADATIEVNGHRFGQRDSGAPMLCSVYCSSLGRHTHIDFCKTPAGAYCGGAEFEHIHTQMTPDPRKPKDYITHALFWSRSGFKDPYAREEQAAFALCDAMCAGPEHQGGDVNTSQPSYCTSPLFHDPVPLVPAPAMGYVSNDGHTFDCANPAVGNQAYHIIFIGDRSSSMSYTDHRPLTGTPVSTLIASRTNNRLGAVFSALYGMWAARQGAGATIRHDAYSVVLFESSARTFIENDLTSTPEELLNQLLGTYPSSGTNFDAALVQARTVMENNWSDDRMPIVIFLSDGECSFTDNIVIDLCRRAVVIGKPLAFHAVSFGQAGYEYTLNRMVTLARDVYRTAPGGAVNADTQCTSTNALDTVRLAETFLGIADSLKKPRAALVKSGK